MRIHTRVSPFGRLRATSSAQSHALTANAVAVKVLTWNIPIDIFTCFLLYFIYLVLSGIRKNLDRTRSSIAHSLERLETTKNIGGGLDVGKQNPERTGVFDRLSAALTRVFICQL